MNKIYPFNTFSTFDDVIFYFNSSIWIYQIATCLIYCLIKRRYLPPPQNTKTSFMIKQLNFYFLSEILIYALEMAYSTIATTMFERFLHHICAILLFTATMLELNMICVFFLVPTFIHSAYWSLIRNGSFSQDIVYSVLMVYNGCLFVSASVILKYSYCKSQVISVRVPFFCTLLFHVNVMSHFYDYNLNLYYIDAEKLTRSVVLSSTITMPIYLYLIYLANRTFKTAKNLNQVLPI